jgi:hypothetical protein
MGKGMRNWVVRKIPLREEGYSVVRLKMIHRDGEDNSFGEDG